MNEHLAHRGYVDTLCQRPRHKRVAPDVHGQIEVDAGHIGNQLQLVVAFLVAHEVQIVVVLAEYGGSLGEQHYSVGLSGLYPLVPYAQVFSLLEHIAFLNLNEVAVRKPI